MNRKFLVPLGLVALSSDPTGSSAGQTYYNTTSDKIRVYNGTSWEDSGLSIQDLENGSLQSITVGGAGDFTIDADANIVLNPASGSTVYIDAATSGNEVVVTSALNSAIEAATLQGPTGTQGANGVQGVQGLQGTSGGGASSSLVLIGNDYLPVTTGLTISDLSTYSNLKFIARYGYNDYANNYVTVNFNGLFEGWDLATMGNVGGFTLIANNQPDYGPRSIFKSTDGITSDIGAGTEYTFAIEIGKANTVGRTTVTITSSYQNDGGSSVFMVQDGIFNAFEVINSLTIASSLDFSMQYRLYGSTTP